MYILNSPNRSQVFRNSGTRPPFARTSLTASASHTGDTFLRTPRFGIGANQTNAGSGQFPKRMGDIEVAKQDEQEINHLVDKVKQIAFFDPSTGETITGIDFLQVFGLRKALKTGVEEQPDSDSVYSQAFKAAMEASSQKKGGLFASFRSSSSRKQDNPYREYGSVTDEMLAPGKNVSSLLKRKVKEKLLELEIIEVKKAAKPIYVFTPKGIAVWNRLFEPDVKESR